MCDRKRSLILTGHLDNRDLDSYVTSQARGWFRRAVTHTHTHRGWRPLQQALISGAFKGREETGSVQSWSWPAAHISQIDSCFCLTAPRTCADPHVKIIAIKVYGARALFIFNQYKQSGNDVEKLKYCPSNSKGSHNADSTHRV